MITAETMSDSIEIRYEDFGEEMADGRLTEHSEGEIYRLRELSCNCPKDIS